MEAPLKSPYKNPLSGISESVTKKSRIRETPTLSTDADSRTATNLNRLRDLSIIVFF